MENKKTHKNIVITGGSGYIGLATAQELAARGYRPILVDICAPKTQINKDDYCYERINILDTKKLTTVLIKYSPLCVFHFAATTDVVWCERNSKACIENNVTSGQSLLQAMYEAKCQRLIFSSSAAVYGNSEHIKPKSVYGKTKRMLEDEIQKKSSVFKIRYGILRYFNVFGMTELSQKDSQKRRNNSLFGQINSIISGGQKVLNLRGDTLSTPDGTAVRDYVHIDDIVAANMRTMEYLLSGGDSIVLPVGTGKGYSVKEIIDGVEKRFGIQIPVRVSSPLSYELSFSRADTRPMERVLQVRPRQYSIEEILERALEA